MKTYFKIIIALCIVLQIIWPGSHTRLFDVSMYVTVVSILGMPFICLLAGFLLDINDDHIPKLEFYWGLEKSGERECWWQLLIIALKSIPAIATATVLLAIVAQILIKFSHIHIAFDK